MVEADATSSKGGRGAGGFWGELGGKRRSFLSPVSGTVDKNKNMPPVTSTLRHAFLATESSLYDHFRNPAAYFERYGGSPF